MERPYIFCGYQRGLNIGEYHENWTSTYVTFFIWTAIGANEDPMAHMQKDENEYYNEIRK